MIAWDTIELNREKLSVCARGAVNYARNFDEESARKTETRNIRLRLRSASFTRDAAERVPKKKRRGATAENEKSALSLTPRFSRASSVREIGGAVFSVVYRPDVEQEKRLERRARYRRNIFTPVRRWLAAERFVLALTSWKLGV